MIKKILYYWLPLLLWCYLIFFLSGIPNLRTNLPGAWDLVLRKIAHMIEYAVLYVLAFRALSNDFAEYGKRKLVISAAVFALLYACTDEIHQSYVPTRGPSFYDVLIDSVGIMIGYTAYNFALEKGFFKNAL